MADVSPDITSSSAGAAVKSLDAEEEQMQSTSQVPESIGLSHHGPNSGSPDDEMWNFTAQKVTNDVIRNSVELLNQSPTYNGVADNGETDWRQTYHQTERVQSRTLQMKQHRTASIEVIESPSGEWNTVKEFRVLSNEGEVQPGDGEDAYYSSEVGLFKFPLEKRAELMGGLSAEHEDLAKGGGCSRDPMAERETEERRTPAHRDENQNMLNQWASEVDDRQPDAETDSTSVGDDDDFFHEMAKQVTDEAIRGSVEVLRQTRFDKDISEDDDGSGWMGTSRRPFVQTDRVQVWTSRTQGGGPATSGPSRVLKKRRTLIRISPEELVDQSVTRTERDVDLLQTTLSKDTHTGEEGVTQDTGSETEAVTNEGIIDQNEDELHSVAYPAHYDSDTIGDIVQIPHRDDGFDFQKEAFVDAHEKNTLPDASNIYTSSQISETILEYVDRDRSILRDAPEISETKKLTKDDTHETAEATHPEDEQELTIPVFNRTKPDPESSQWEKTEFTISHEKTIGVDQEPEQTKHSLESKMNIELPTFFGTKDQSSESSEKDNEKSDLDDWYRWKDSSDTTPLDEIGQEVVVPSSELDYRHGEYDEESDDPELPVRLLSLTMTSLEDESTPVNIPQPTESEILLQSKSPQDSTEKELDKGIPEGRGSADFDILHDRIEASQFSEVKSTSHENVDERIGDTDNLEAKVGPLQQRTQIYVHRAGDLSKRPEDKKEVDKPALDLPVIFISEDTTDQNPESELSQWEKTEFTISHAEPSDLGGEPEQASRSVENKTGIELPTVFKRKHREIEDDSSDESGLEYDVSDLDDRKMGHEDMSGEVVLPLSKSKDSLESGSDEEEPSSETEGRSVRLTSLKMTSLEDEESSAINIPQPSDSDILFQSKFSEGIHGEDVKKGAGEVQRSSYSATAEYHLPVLDGESLEGPSKIPEEDKKMEKSALDFPVIFGSGDEMTGFSVSGKPESDWSEWEKTLGEVEEKEKKEADEKKEKSALDFPLIFGPGDETTGFSVGGKPESELSQWEKTESIIPQNVTFGVDEQLGSMQRSVESKTVIEMPTLFGRRRPEDESSEESDSEAEKPDMHHKQDDLEPQLESMSQQVVMTSKEPGDIFRDSDTEDDDSDVPERPVRLMSLTMTSLEDERSVINISQSPESEFLFHPRIPQDFAEEVTEEGLPEGRSSPDLDTSHDRIEVSETLQLEKLPSDDDIDERIHDISEMGENVGPFQQRTMLYVQKVEEPPKKPQEKIEEDKPALDLPVIFKSDNVTDVAVSRKPESELSQWEKTEFTISHETTTGIDIEPKQAKQSDETTWEIEIPTFYYRKTLLNRLKDEILEKAHEKSDEDDRKRLEDSFEAQPLQEISQEAVLPLSESKDSLESGSDEEEPSSETEGRGVRLLSLKVTSLEDEESSPINIPQPSESGILLQSEHLLESPQEIVEEEDIHFSELHDGHRDSDEESDDSELPGRPVRLLSLTMTSLDDENTPVNIPQSSESEVLLQSKVPQDFTEKEIDEGLPEGRGSPVEDILHDRIEASKPLAFVDSATHKDAGDVDLYSTEMQQRTLIYVQKVVDSSKKAVENMDESKPALDLPVIFKSDNVTDVAVSKKPESELSQWEKTEFTISHETAAGIDVEPKQSKRSDEIRTDIELPAFFDTKLPDLKDESSDKDHEKSDEDDWKRWQDSFEAQPLHEIGQEVVQPLQEAVVPSSELEDRYRGSDEESEDSELPGRPVRLLSLTMTSLEDENTPVNIPLSSESEVLLQSKVPQDFTEKEIDEGLPEGRGSPDEDILHDRIKASKPLEFVESASHKNAGDVDLDSAEMQQRTLIYVQKVVDSSKKAVEKMDESKPALDLPVIFISEDTTDENPELELSQWEKTKSTISHEEPSDLSGEPEQASRSVESKTGIELPTVFKRKHREIEDESSDESGLEYEVSDLDDRRMGYEDISGEVVLPLSESKDSLESGSDEEEPSSETEGRGVRLLSLKVTSLEDEESSPINIPQPSYSDILFQSENLQKAPQEIVVEEDLGNLSSSSDSAIIQDANEESAIPVTEESLQITSLSVSKETSPDDAEISRDTDQIQLPVFFGRKAWEPEEEEAEEKVKVSALDFPVLFTPGSDAVVLGKPESDLSQWEKTESIISQEATFGLNEELQNTSRSVESKVGIEMPTHFGGDRQPKVEEDEESSEGSGEEYKISDLEDKLGEQTSGFTPLEDIGQKEFVPSTETGDSELKDDDEEEDLESPERSVRLMSLKMTSLEDETSFIDIPQPNDSEVLVQAGISQEGKEFSREGLSSPDFEISHEKPESQAIDLDDLLELRPGDVLKGPSKKDTQTESGVSQIEFPLFYESNLEESESQKLATEDKSGLDYPPMFRPSEEIGVSARGTAEPELSQWEKTESVISWGEAIGTSEEPGKISAKLEGRADIDMPTFYGTEVPKEEEDRSEEPGADFGASKLDDRSAREHAIEMIPFDLKQDLALSSSESDEEDDSLETPERNVRLLSVKVTSIEDENTAVNVPLVPEPPEILLQSEIPHDNEVDRITREGPEELGSPDSDISQEESKVSIPVEIGIATSRDIAKEPAIEKGVVGQEVEFPLLYGQKLEEPKNKREEEPERKSAIDLPVMILPSDGCGVTDSFTSKSELFPWEKTESDAAYEATFNVYGKPEDTSRSVASEIGIELPTVFGKRPSEADEESSEESSGEYKITDLDEALSRQDTLDISQHRFGDQKMAVPFSETSPQFVESDEEPESPERTVRLMSLKMTSLEDESTDVTVKQLSDSAILLQSEVLDDIAQTEIEPSAIETECSRDFLYDAPEVPRSTELENAVKTISPDVSEDSLAESMNAIEQLELPVVYGEKSEKEQEEEAQKKSEIHFPVLFTPDDGTDVAGRGKPESELSQWEKTESVTTHETAVGDEPEQTTRIVEGKAEIELPTLFDPARYKIEKESSEESGEADEFSKLDDRNVIPEIIGEEGILPSYEIEDKPWEIGVDDFSGTAERSVPLSSSDDEDTDLIISNLADSETLFQSKSPENVGGEITQDDEAINLEDAGEWTLIDRDYVTNDLNVKDMLLDEALDEPRQDLDVKDMLLDETPDVPRQDLNVKDMLLDEAPDVPRQEVNVKDMLLDETPDVARQEEQSSSWFVVKEDHFGAGLEGVEENIPFTEQAEFGVADESNVLPVDSGVLDFGLDSELSLNPVLVERQKSQLSQQASIEGGLYMEEYDYERPWTPIAEDKNEIQIVPEMEELGKPPSLEHKLTRAIDDSKRTVAPIPLDEVTVTDDDRNEEEGRKVMDFNVFEKQMALDTGETVKETEAGLETREPGPVEGDTIESKYDQGLVYSGSQEVLRDGVGDVHYDHPVGKEEKVSEFEDIPWRIHDYEKDDVWAGKRKAVFLPGETTILDQLEPEMVPSPEEQKSKLDESEIPDKEKGKKKHRTNLVWSPALMDEEDTSPQDDEDESLVKSSDVNIYLQSADEEKLEETPDTTPTNEEVKGLDGSHLLKVDDEMLEKFSPPYSEDEDDRSDWADQNKRKRKEDLNKEVLKRRSERHAYDNTGFETLEHFQPEIQGWEDTAVDEPGTLEFGTDARSMISGGLRKMRPEGSADDSEELLFGQPTSVDDKESTFIVNPETEVDVEGKEMKQEISFGKVEGFTLSGEVPEGTEDDLERQRELSETEFKLQTRERPEDETKLLIEDRPEDESKFLEKRFEIPETHSKFLEPVTDDGFVWSEQPAEETAQKQTVGESKFFETGKDDEFDEFSRQEDEPGVTSEEHVRAHERESKLFEPGKDDEFGWSEQPSEEIARKQFEMQENESKLLEFGKDDEFGLDEVTPEKPFDIGLQEPELLEPRIDDKVGWSKQPFDEAAEEGFEVQEDESKLFETGKDDEFGLDEEKPFDIGLQEPELLEPRIDDKVGWSKRPFDEAADEGFEVQEDESKLFGPGKDDEFGLDEVTPEKPFDIGLQEPELLEPRIDDKVGWSKNPFDEAAEEGFEVKENDSELFDSGKDEDFGWSEVSLDKPLDVGITDSKLNEFGTDELALSAKPFEVSAEKQPGVQDTESKLFESEMDEGFVWSEKPSEESAGKRIGMQESESKLLEPEIDDEFGWSEVALEKPSAVDLQETKYLESGLDDGVVTSAQPSGIVEDKEFGVQESDSKLFDSGLDDGFVWTEKPADETAEKRLEMQETGSKLLEPVEKQIEALDDESKTLKARTDDGFVWSEEPTKETVEKRFEVQETHSKFLEPGIDDGFVWSEQPADETARKQIESESKFFDTGKDEDFGWSDVTPEKPLDADLEESKLEPGTHDRLVLSTQLHEVNAVKDFEVQEDQSKMLEPEVDDGFVWSEKPSETSAEKRPEVQETESKLLKPGIDDEFGWVEPEVIPVPGHRVEEDEMRSFQPGSGSDRGELLTSGKEHEITKELQFHEPESRAALFDAPSHENLGVLTTKTDSTKTDLTPDADRSLDRDFVVATRKDATLESAVDRGDVEKAKLTDEKFIVPPQQHLHSAFAEEVTLLSSPPRRTNLGNEAEKAEVGKDALRSLQPRQEKSAVLVVPVAMDRKQEEQMAAEPTEEEILSDISAIKAGAKVPTVSSVPAPKQQVSTESGQADSFPTQHYTECRQSAHDLITRELGSPEFDHRQERETFLFQEGARKRPTLVPRSPEANALATKSQNVKTSSDFLNRAGKPVGAVGFAVVNDDVNIPPNEFFTPGRAFDVRIKHSNFPTTSDDRRPNFKTMSVKLSDNDVDSPLDLVLRTGQISPYCNADSLDRFQAALRSGKVQAIKDELMTTPACTEAVMDGLRHLPDSYYDQHYYSPVIYDFRSTDGARKYLARFRVIPKDGAVVETGRIKPEQRGDVWTFLSPEYLPSTTKSANYLRDDYRRRLEGSTADTPVDSEGLRYDLQIQIHEMTREEAEKTNKWYNPCLLWNEPFHPWVSLATITAVDTLPGPSTRSTQFTLNRLPRLTLALPAATSPQDFNSVAETLNEATKTEQKMEVPSRVMEKAGIGAKQAEYYLYCVTGNRTNAGTLSNVFVSIVGSKGRTGYLKLEPRYRTDFERSGKATFLLVDKPVGYLRYIKVFKEKHTTPSDWYLDYLILSTPYNNKSYTLPCYRWLTDRIALLSVRDGPGILNLSEMTEDSKVQRVIEVSVRRQQLQWRVAHGENPYSMLPGYLRNGEQLGLIPLDLQSDAMTALETQWKEHRAGKFSLFKTIMKFFTSRKATISVEFEKTLADTIADKYENSKVMVHILRHWREDAEFGRQLINGIAPFRIQRLESLPPNFRITNDVVKDSLEPGRTLEQEMQDGRIFLVSFADLLEPSIICLAESGGNAGTVRRQKGKQLPPRYISAPTILLYSTRGDKPTIIPIAIQLSETQTSPGGEPLVFTKQDDKGTYSDWMVAKMWVRVAATNTLILGPNIMFHLMMEPVAISLLRNLPAVHPIHKLLVQHLKDIVAINAIYRQHVLPVDGALSEVLAMTREVPLQYMAKVIHGVDLGSFDGEAVFRQLRLLTGDDILPGYWLRDDLLRHLAAIKDFVRDVIGFYYKSNSDVSSDAELKEFFEDLRQSGGLSTTTVPQTADDLIRFVSAIIFMCTSHQAAVSRGLLDTFAYCPNSPPCMMKPPPTTRHPNGYTEQQMKDMLPNPDHVERFIGFVMLLFGGYKPAEVALGSYPDRYFTEEPVLVAIENFRRRLRQISEDIRLRNSNIDCPFEYLLPEKVHQNFVV